MKPFVLFTVALGLMLGIAFAQGTPAGTGASAPVTPPPTGVAPATQPGASAPAVSEAPAPTGKPASQPLPPSGGLGSLGGFLPIILIFVVFYFLLIMPQQRQRKKHQEMLTALKAGDRVVVLGGVHGIITRMRDATIFVKIAESTEVEVDRGAVSHKVGQETK